MMDDRKRKIEEIEEFQEQTKKVKARLEETKVSIQEFNAKHTHIIKKCVNDLESTKEDVNEFVKDDKKTKKKKDEKKSKREKEKQLLFQKIEMVENNISSSNKERVRINQATKALTNKIRELETLGQSMLDRIVQFENGYLQQAINTYKNPMYYRTSTLHNPQGMYNYSRETVYPSCDSMIK